MAVSVISRTKLKVIDGNQQRYLPYDQLKTIDPEQAFGIDITKKENHLIGERPSGTVQEAMIIILF